ncbi:MAG: sensor histidine kinase [Pseudomonadota bacterium]
MSAIFQIVLAVVLTGGLSFYHGQLAVKQFAGNLHNEVTGRVHDRLQAYLAAPPHINELNAEAIKQGVMTPGNREAVERRLWRQAHHFNSVSYIGLAFSNGLYVGAQRINSDSAIIVEFRDESTNNALQTWSTNEQGERIGIRDESPDYNPLERPWYTKARDKGEPVWSDIYQYTGSQGSGLSANTPVYDSENNLLAVLSTDLTLDGIGKFLKELEADKNGKRIFMTDCHGELLVSTNKDHDEPLFTAAMTELIEESNSGPNCAENIDNASTANHWFEHQGTEYLIQISQHDQSLKPALNWWIVVITPTEQYMAPVIQNTWIVAGVLFVATLLAIVLAATQARRVVQPIEQLNQAAQSLAGGDWEHELSLDRRDEVGQLAHNFKRMAWQLQESFTQMETKVQQRTQDLASRNDELSALNQQLIQLNQDKNEFLSIIAHDLKNPLGSIQSIVDLLKHTLDDCDTEELLENLDMIETSAIRMSSLVSNLLDANAIESGRMPLSPSNVDVVPIIDTLVSYYQNLSARKQINLLLETKGSMCRLYVDAYAIQSIFDNLLSNAVKYSPVGTDVMIRMLPQEDVVRFEIQDQGPGLTEADQQKLFGKYNRLSAKPTDGEHSTGLGLFIVKQLVDAMNGKVWCESAGGKGAMFVVTLPREKHLETAVLSEAN